MIFIIFPGPNPKDPIIAIILKIIAIFRNKDKK